MTHCPLRLRRRTPRSRRTTPRRRGTASSPSRGRRTGPGCGPPAPATNSSPRDLLLRRHVVQVDPDVGEHDRLGLVVVVPVRDRLPGHVLLVQPAGEAVVRLAGQQHVHVQVLLAVLVGLVQPGGGRRRGRCGRWPAAGASARPATGRRRCRCRMSGSFGRTVRDSACRARLSPLRTCPPSSPAPGGCPGRTAGRGRRTRPRRPGQVVHRPHLVRAARAGSRRRPRSWRCSLAELASLARSGMLRLGEQVVVTPASGSRRCHRLGLGSRDLLLDGRAEQLDDRRVRRRPCRRAGRGCRGPRPRSGRRR